MLDTFAKVMLNSDVATKTTAAKVLEEPGQYVRDRAINLPPCPHCTSRFCSLVCRFYGLPRFAFMEKK